MQVTEPIVELDLYQLVLDPERILFWTKTVQFRNLPRYLSSILAVDKDGRFFVSTQEGTKVKQLRIDRENAHEAVIHFNSVMKKHLDD